MVNLALIAMVFAFILGILALIVPGGWGLGIGITAISFALFATGVFMCTTEETIGDG